MRPAKICRQRVRGSRRRSIEIALTSATLLFAVAASPASAADAGDRLAYVATPVVANFTAGASVGSGFFYQELGPRDPEGPGFQWRTVTKLYVVTNRHVLLPRNLPSDQGPRQATVADVESLQFSLAAERTTGGVEWVPIKLSNDEFANRVQCHPSIGVDVAVVSVLDLVAEAYKERSGTLRQWSAVTSEELPEDSELSVGAGEEVIVIGYPKQYHDPVNKLPIMKLGLLSTPWGTKFRGEEAFLVDLRNFKGASGSVIVTRPTSLWAGAGGQLLTSKSKQYLFLGVYSGEPHMGDPNDTVDLGIGWYGRTVPETINAGSKDTCG